MALMQSAGIESQTVEQISLFADSPAPAPVYAPSTDKSAETPATMAAAPSKPTYKIGDTVYLEDSKEFIINEIHERTGSVQLSNPTLRYPIFRAEAKKTLNGCWHGTAETKNILFRLKLKISEAPQPNIEKLLGQDGTDYYLFHLPEDPMLPPR